MWKKWKKGLVWLLMVMLVLGTAAGCGTASGGQPERALVQEQKVEETVQGEKAAEAQEISEAGEEPGEGKESEDWGEPEESGGDENRKESEESGGGKNPKESEESGGGGNQKESEESGEGENRKKTEKSAQREDQKYSDETNSSLNGDSIEIEEDGTYISKDEVALYLHIYGYLPDNYITKKEAQDLGWDSKKGNLDQVAPGMSIGGSYFGNYEGMLPEKKGRKYYECDLDYEGGYRGAKRLIYSNDGLIFYTEDHYKTFEQLY